MAYVVNEQIATVVYTGSAGETFTRTYSEINGVETAFTVTFTDIGNGYYRATYTPTQAGSFIWYGESSGGVPVNFDWDVDATGVTVTALSAAGALTVTLAELRRRVARRFGDYTQLTATASGNVGKTTLIDTLNVNTATEDMKGRILLFTSGTNAGLTARVTGQDDATGTLTFTPAATAQTAPGDTFDVFNKRGKGFTPQEYTAAINDAINDAFPLGLIEVRTDITPAFAYATPEVTVPASMTHVHTVEWGDEEGYWHLVPRAARANEYGWVADPAAGELRILGSPGYSVDGLTLRLTGYGRQETLSAETDTCALNAEYVVARACYHLALGALDKDGAYGQRAGVFLQEAKELRSRLRRYWHPMAERVRAA